ncbi:MAG: PorT family protein [Paludibacteraceae bacterium]|nr:PorT family protein [Paludibacteraceae bacterium]
MKKVKFLLASLAIIAASSLNAQGFGVQAGYSNSTTFIGEGDTLSNLNGFHVGPIAELRIQGPFSLRYGLFYNYQTGTKTFNLIKTKMTTTFHSVDIPVHLAFTIPTGSPVGVFVFGGPSFNVGISKKTTIKVDSKSLEPIDYYKTDDNGDSRQSRFDIQMGVGAGIKLQNLQFRLSYDWGLLDTNNSDNYSLTRDELKASVAFVL